MFQKVLKKHSDVITVATEIKKMFDEYQSNGYFVTLNNPSHFSIFLDDGTVHIYWVDGFIYQDIYEKE